jgi:hypothetical protein
MESGAIPGVDLSQGRHAARRLEIARGTGLCFFCGCLLGEIKGKNLIMEENATEILRRALKLPPQAGATPSGSLHDSLDRTVAPEAASAWEAEVLLRMKELDEGEVQSALRVAGYELRVFLLPQCATCKMQIPILSS